MEMPIIDPGWYAGLPPEIRAIVGVAIFFAALWAAIKGYRGTPPAAVQKTEDVRIIQGAFADVSPWRHIADTLDRMARASEESAKDLKRCAEGIEDLVEIRNAEAADTQTAKIARAVAEAMRDHPKK